MKFVSRISGLRFAISRRLDFRFLTGVTRKCWPQLFIDAGGTDEFFQFFKLAVGQCVHGIDDDRSRLPTFPSSTRSHDRVDDRNEEAKRLAGASSRCDDKALATLRLCDGSLLMSMEADRLAMLAYRKYAAKFGIQNPIGNQSIDAGALFVARVDCDERGRPEAVLVICRIDLLSDLGGVNTGEGPCEFGIAVNQRSIEFEDIQGTPQCECVLNAVKILHRVAERRRDAKSQD